MGDHDDRSSKEGQLGRRIASYMALVIPSLHRQLQLHMGWGRGRVLACSATELDNDDVNFVSFTV